MITGALRVRSAAMLNCIILTRAVQDSDTYLRIKLLEVGIMLTPDHVGQFMNQRFPDPIISAKPVQVICAQAQGNLPSCRRETAL